MRKSSNITQAQIAKMLNISTVTVSKALRNHPDISSETIHRVKKLADEIGYTPDLIARALSSRRSNIIGVVVPEIDHTFFSAVTKGIYSASKDQQFQVLLTVSHEDEQRELENLHTLIAMRVDGVLISISENTQNYNVFKMIQRKGIPLVFFDRYIADPDFTRVIVDDRKGAKDAVAHLASKGRRTIAHLGGTPQVSVSIERLAGYKEGLEAAGIPFDENWVMPCGFSEEEGYKGFMALVKGAGKPDAVFAVNDPVAIGVYDAARELGFRIPQDLGVVGFSDLTMAKYMSPPLTSVHQPALDLGKQAVAALLEAIQKPDSYIPREIVMPTKLVERESG
jgi:LacI family transcriptional regulator